MKDLFRVRRMWRPRGRAQAPLRRRDHRRRLARPRDRLLPREEPRHHATSPCSSSPTSAPARRAATRRSSARTTARPRAPRSTSASVELYERLSAELDFNLMFSQHGHLTLAHSDRALERDAASAPRRTSCSGSTRGSCSRTRSRSSARSSTSPTAPTWPILGALYHPPGGIIRHDAVVWGYARGADRRGVEIHQGTEVTGIERRERPRDRRRDQPRPRRGRTS